MSTKERRTSGIPVVLLKAFSLFAAFALGAEPLLSGETDQAAERRSAIVNSARSLIGKTVIVVRERKFASDCSGTVQAACWGAGLDLAKAMSKAKGANGVALIHDALSRGGALVPKTERPRPGDIVFWDDTYDKNGNGKADDPLSHVGVIVSSGKNGQYSYVHYRYDKGVVEESMNLDFPGTKDSSGGVRLNSNIRIRTWKPDARYLSGELYRSSGSAANLKEGWEAGA